MMKIEDSDYDDDDPDIILQMMIQKFGPNILLAGQWRPFVPA